MSRKSRTFAPEIMSKTASLCPLNRFNRQGKRLFGRLCDNWKTKIKKNWTKNCHLYTFITVFDDI